MKMSLLERSEVEIDRNEVDLQQLISQVITTFSNRPEYRTRRLHSEIDNQATHVLADFNRIDEVLTHLVDNALRFSDPIDEVVIQCELCTTQHIRISVIDLGSGVAESVREQIFESLQQADTSHTRDHGGLGLGLSLAAGIVALHDSTLELSTLEGQGSTFSFELPKVDKPS